MNKINPHKLGLTVGALLGVWHLFWSVLVAAGLAGPLANFILRLHFLEISHVVKDFDLGTAALLVVVTSLVGYAVGLVAGVICNWVHRQ